MGPSVNIHLPGPPQGTTYTVTHPDGTITTISASPASMTPVSGGVTSTATAPLPSAVEKMIGRHEKNGVKGTRSREVAEALIGRGWEPIPGPKYLRYVFKGAKDKAT